MYKRQAPTEWAGGFTGYSSQPMYEQALAELKAKQPGAVAQYDALFGGNVPTTWGNNPRFRGSAGGSPPTTDPENRWKDKASHIMDTLDKERDRGTALESGVKQAQDDYNTAVAAGTNWDKPRGYTPAEAKLYEEMAKKDAINDTQGTLMKWPAKPPVKTVIDSWGPRGYPKKKVDKMIVDDNVQKTRGFSPQMAQFLVNDANKIMNENKTRNSNYPEEHFTPLKNENMEMYNLPWANRLNNPYK